MRNISIVDKDGINKVNNHLTIVRKSLKAEEKIEKHNHIGFNVSFTLMSGKGVFKIGEETFTAEGPKVINFDGEMLISVEAETDMEIFVFLMKKN